MNRVMLICSIHKEMGNATAGELAWLLGQLQPEVLFLEHSSAAHAAFLEGSRGTLESLAVKQYEMQRAVDLAPVDLAFDAPPSKAQFDEMFDRIAEANPRYRGLEMANSEETARGGLAYLNSPIGYEMQTAINMEMRVTVDAIAEPRLTSLYDLWVRTHTSREETIVAGIEEYGAQKPFKSGALIIGAAHRQAILERTRAARSGAPSSIAWDFDWEL